MKLLRILGYTNCCNEPTFRNCISGRSVAFLSSLDRKHYEKILYNIRKAQSQHDPELFKKLKDEIWEFRTLYQGLQYRLLAFWDKTDAENTLVISTNGFIKKQSKVPENEIRRAKLLRAKYFEDKQALNKNKK